MSWDQWLMMSGVAVLLIGFTFEREPAGQEREFRRFQVSKTIGLAFLLPPTIWPLPFHLALGLTLVGLAPLWWGIRGARRCRARAQAARLSPPRA